MSEQAVREPEAPVRGRGRPKAETPSSALTAWVPTTLHDKLIALAARNEESVSATVRALLELKVKAHLK